MDTHEDTGFLINHFEPSSERGNFSNRAKYGDIPSSHGDIPVVFCLVHGIGLSATTGFFQNFYPLGALFWLLQVSKMQVSRPVRSLLSDSLRREPIIYSGTQPNYFTKHLPATSSFLFRQQQPIQTNQLLLRNTTVGVLRTLENVGRTADKF